MASNRHFPSSSIGRMVACEPVSVKTDKAAHSMQICRSPGFGGRSWASKTLVARTWRKPQLRQRRSGVGGFASISAPASKSGRLPQKGDLAA
jgi:hypothetical protein